MDGSKDSLVALIRERSKRIRPLPTAVKERGRLPRTPRGLLFDVYGTLLARIGSIHPNPARMMDDVEGLIRRHRLPVTASVLEDGIQEAVAKEHSARKAVGNAYPEVRIELVWSRLFPHRPQEEIRRMIVEYELARHPAWPMPGSRALLRSLAVRGLALGIVSNAQFYTPLFLRALLGANLEELGFSHSLCLYSFDIGVAKPGHQVFDLAAQRLRGVGIAAGEVVMIGNNHRSDIVPGARSGLMTVHAALDRRSWVPARPQEGALRADAVISSMRGLRALIEEAL